MCVVCGHLLWQPWGAGPLIRMDVFPASLLGRRRGASGPDGKEGLTTQPPGASGFSFQGLALSAEPCDKALAVTVHWHLRLDSAWGSSWVLAAIQLLATSGSGALAPLSTGLWPPGKAATVDQKPRAGSRTCHHQLRDPGQMCRLRRVDCRVPGWWRFLTKRFPLVRKGETYGGRLLCLQGRGAGEMEGWASQPRGSSAGGHQGPLCLVPYHSDGETEAQPSLSHSGTWLRPGTSHGGRAPSSQRHPSSWSKGWGSRGAPALPPRFSLTAPSSAPSPPQAECLAAKSHLSHTPPASLSFLFVFQPLINSIHPKPPWVGAFPPVGQGNLPPQVSSLQGPPLSWMDVGFFFGKKLGSKLGWAPHWHAVSVFSAGGGELCGPTL